MIEAFSTGFYNKLIGDSALQTKLGGAGADKKIYNTVAPQGASLPYITFGLLTDRPEGVMMNLGRREEMTFYINIFSDTGIEHAMEIVDLVKTAMDDCALTITGYTHMLCMREYVGSVIPDELNSIYQIPMRYLVWACKN